MTNPRSVEAVVKRTSLLSKLSSENNLIGENRIIDGGAPFRIAGIDQISRLCDAMSLEVKVEPPRMNYHHGWGKSCADAKPVIGTCYMHTTDVQRKPTEIPFDVIKGNSPMIIGLEVERHSNSVSMTQPQNFTFLRRDVDTQSSTFYKHHAKDSFIVLNATSGVTSYRTLIIRP